MAKSLKKSLSQRAEENTTVTKGTSKNQSVLKQGTPNDHSRKHEVQKSAETLPVVGVSIGITKNMDNYESLRVDCWLTDVVSEEETVEQAYERVVAVVDKTLQDTVSSYIE